MSASVSSPTGGKTVYRVEDVGYPVSSMSFAEFLEGRGQMPTIHTGLRGGCHRWGRICDCKIPTADQPNTEFPGFCKDEMNTCMQFWC
ncbi:hypothetical protein RvY_03875 [Ramazzottius varieornatus]|uniref:Uncharacterized protein n=1 Tax=Ramazzottius varieornatus TaxID=947166 RepID=A0A1D1UT14_RAMVA|nr:hypothetical protein RvY_03875 [Ramazzottius varieornatus]